MEIMEAWPSGVVVHRHSPTSPLSENAPLPHRSVGPPDLDLRQVPRASEERGRLQFGKTRRDRKIDLPSTSGDSTSYWSNKQIFNSLCVASP
jgi:hypothetical protein